MSKESHGLCPGSDLFRETQGEEEKGKFQNVWVTMEGGGEKHSAGSAPLPYKT